MSSIDTICIYCGSSSGHDPAFAASASDLGKAMAQEGIRLVYGGGKNGLMGTAAKAVVANGGFVTGVIPGFLKSKEQLFTEAQEIIDVPDMHTRKRIMFEKADAFVALPGGIGTLEELVEQMTWAQLGRHTKPILMLDIGGFWRPLLGLIAHMRNSGFVRPEFEVNYLVAERTADVIPMLKRAAARHGVKADVELIGTRF